MQIIDYNRYKVSVLTFRKCHIAAAEGPRDRYVCVLGGARAGGGGGALLWHNIHLNFNIDTTDRQVSLTNIRLYLDVEWCSDDVLPSTKSNTISLLEFGIWQKISS